MKDSQRGTRFVTASGKYIKADNERFSTVEAAARPAL